MVFLAWVWQQGELLLPGLSATEIHDHAEIAAEASRCALEQGKFPKPIWSTAMT
jgi:hypothetical protein